MGYKCLRIEKPGRGTVWNFLASNWSKKVLNHVNENRSLIPWGAKVLFYFASLASPLFLLMEIEMSSHGFGQVWFLSFVSHIK